MLLDNACIPAWESKANKYTIKASYTQTHLTAKLHLLCFHTTLAHFKLNIDCIIQNQLQ